jgi:hypothetical protein
MWQVSEAQTSLRYEYWFNNNVQTRNSNVLVPNNAQGDVSFSMNTDTLPLGLNTVHIRFVKNDTSWSAISSYLFYRSNDATNATIAAGQYWFNDQLDSAKTFATNGQSVLQNVDIQSLPIGLHRFNVRFRGAAGYSSTTTYLFYKLKNEVEGVEYWIENQVEQRIFKPLILTPDTNFAVRLDISVLCDGWYRLNTRLKKTTGWSSATRDSIYLVSTGGNLIRTDSMKHTSCGLVNGMIAITRPSAGIAPFQYALNQGSFQNAPLFNNLNSGTYTLKVKDSIK